jgi:hypothetical protein
MAHQLLAKVKHLASRLLLTPLDLPGSIYSFCDRDFEMGRRPFYVLSHVDILMNLPYLSVEIPLLLTEETQNCGIGINEKPKRKSGT